MGRRSPIRHFTTTPQVEALLLVGAPLLSCGSCPTQQSKRGYEFHAPATTIVTQNADDAFVTQFTAQDQTFGYTADYGDETGITAAVSD